MNRSSLYTALFLTIFFFGLLLCVSGCSGSGGGGGGGVAILSGTVFNISYEAISNADVAVESATTKTQSNGIYSFVNIPSGDRSINISSQPHTPAYRKVSLPAGASVNADVAFLADLDGKVTIITSTATETASNQNGKIKMVFPVGAFSVPTKVTLTSVPKVAAPLNAPTKDQFVSFIVYAQADPATSTLLSPAKLYLPNLTSITTETVPFFRFDTGILQWVPLAIGTNESPNNSKNPLSVNTDYLGWIAAIMTINPAPGTITGTITNSNPPFNAIANANVWTDSFYAVTDSFGKYTLEYVPTGLTTVQASALGFTPAEKHLVILSTIASDCSFSLDPISQGDISGTVKSSSASSPIANARVVGTYSPGRRAETYTDAYGRYTLFNLPLGTINLAAYATGFKSSTESIILSQTISGIEFILIPTATPPNPHFIFTGGTNEGFLPTGLWHIQDPNQISAWNGTSILTDYFIASHDAGAVTRKVKLPDNGTIPPLSGSLSSYYFWYGQASPSTAEGSYIDRQYYDDIVTTESFTGGFSDSTHITTGTLESPDIDLTGYANAKLSFWSWWEIEGLNPSTKFDIMQVLVKTHKDGVLHSLGFLNPYEDPQGVVWSGEAYSSGGYDQPGVWVQYNVDLSPYVGDIVSIVFKFDAGDQKFNGYRGWFIDDISITDSQMGVSSFGRNLTPYLIGKPRNK